MQQSLPWKSPLQPIFYHVEPILFMVCISNLAYMTLSQLNDTNTVQKWSFSKCVFSTYLASKIKGKHVFDYIKVLFLQKIAWGAS